MSCPETYQLALGFGFMLIALVPAYCLSGNFSIAFINFLFFGFGLILKFRASGIVEFYKRRIKFGVLF